MSESAPAAVDQAGFRRILTRNIALPAAAGLASAIVFVGLILYLLSSMRWVDHTQEVIGNANEISRLAVDMESGMRGYLLTGDDAFLAPYRISKPKIASAMATLKQQVIDNQPQVDRLTRIAALQAQWDNFAMAAIVLRRNGGDYLKVVATGRGRQEFDEIRREFADFLDIEQRLRQERIDTSQRVTTGVILIYLLVSLGLTGLLALLGRRDLKLLATTYGEALEQHREHAAVLERQAWQRTGQSQLAQQSMGQLLLSQLGGTVLEFLATYINTSVAAVYVREDSGTLERVASYGFSREQLHTTQAFNDDESLVGQAARGRRLIHLEQVPDGYLTVNSGLGQGKPVSVLLLPLEQDDEVIGVIELGFLHRPHARVLEFLDMTALSVAAAFKAALYRRRLQDVLQKTRQLNEELQMQQEELRTANEELEQQSRVLADSQAILENQKAELQQSNDQLADQTTALDQKNAALSLVQVELEARASDLQRASKYKSEFLANMSHELRTPLNSSLILAKLLMDNPKGNLDPEQLQFAETIYSAGNDLLNLINDILDISKVEAGKLELAPEPIRVQRLLDGLHMSFAPLAQQKNLHFSVTLAAAAPQMMFADRQRLEQILKNLLSNALKFTETGSVALEVSAHGSRIAFAVRDTGIGIPAHQQDIIFEAFQQADGTTSRRYGGTGLGLSISRDLASLLGGTITVSSVPEQGSIFTLDMPLTATLPEVVAPASPAPTPVPVPKGVAPAEIPVFADDRHHVPLGRSVLVIEDDAEFAGILYEVAHEAGYQCLVSHGAADGLQTASEFLPDAVLLDLRLPDDSGMAVLQKLKANPRTRHIPVHIVSASDRTEVALQLGAIGYVMKPATRDRLQQVFQKLEARLTQKVKRVLLVEDDARQRESVVHLIEDTDVEIVAVESGEEAIALLRDTVFDCMIIDLRLPDMQGHELLQRVAEEDVCAFPPVIVYTGRNLTRAEEDELLKYSRSIIVKGARSPERLLDEVTLFLHRVESELSAERQSMLRTVRSRDRIFEGRRVLLVDDDVRNIFSLTSALEQKGLKVEVGRNGFEAIARLDEVADIDLVLMDIMMPGMDGLEAMRRIRADGRFAKLPIIAITAKAMKDDQEQCLQAGASDYLAKPVDLDRLYSLLRVWMPNMERI